MTDEEIAAEIRALLAKGGIQYIAAYSVPQSQRMRITLKIEAMRCDVIIFWMTPDRLAIVEQEKRRRLATAIPPEMWMNCGLAAPCPDLKTLPLEPVAPRAPGEPGPRATSCPREPGPGGPSHPTKPGEE